MERKGTTISVDKNIKSAIDNLINQKKIPFPNMKSFVDYHLRSALERYEKKN